MRGFNAQRRRELLLDTGTPRSATLTSGACCGRGAGSLPERIHHRLEMAGAASLGLCEVKEPQLAAASRAAAHAARACV
jgi:hypothetical protein